MRNLIVVVVISLFACGSIMAGDIVDQEQLVTDTSRPRAVGGGPASEQKIAQTFTVGTTGFITQIRLPISCNSGELIVEIQRLGADGKPNGVVVGSERIAAGDLPTPQTDFKTIFFSPPLAVRSGEKFAIVLSNPTGSCGLLAGPEGDSYAGGESFFDARPNPPGWANRSGDFAFQTVVDDGGSGGSSNFCFGTFGAGPIPLPINADVPLCRCVSDAGSNSWGCRMFHPDFFIIRRIEFPPNARGRFTERWAFTPLTKLSGPVKMRFKGDGLRAPIVHEFGKRSKEGKFEFFKISRKMSSGGARINGEATFSYPMKIAVSPFLRKFGFDAAIPAIDGKKAQTTKKKSKVNKSN